MKKWRTKGRESELEQKMKRREKKENKMTWNRKEKTQCLVSVTK